VPSRLDERATRLASVVLLASADAAENERSLGALAMSLPTAADLVVVADDVEVAASGGHEVVRTSASLGRGAAMNIGIRRATGEVIVAMDPSIVPTGDVVTPLVEALRDPSVAVAGPFGLVSRDLRRFEELVPSTAPVDAAAIEGYLIGFRRSDIAARGPIDEGFRFYRNLDVWLSLLLRDEGEGATPRRAVAVPGLPLERGEPAAWRLTAAAERDRLSRRNFYRVLDRFRTRLDLAVPPG
jgi:glycosyltransferase involved in cell wall biosynthesis